MSDEQRKVATAPPCRGAKSVRKPGRGSTPNALARQFVVGGIPNEAQSDAGAKSPPNSRAGNAETVKADSRAPIQATACAGDENRRVRRGATGNAMRLPLEPTGRAPAEDA